MKTLALAVLLVACTDRADDDYPVLPGHGFGVPGETSGAISGRVCLIMADPRALATCADTGADNITVALGGVTTTTGANGAFTLVPPAASNLVFTVSGPSIVTSSQIFSPTNVIPAINADLFEEVLAANGIVLTPGSGSIFGSVLARGVPAAGVTAASTPSPAFGPFFDGTTPTSFTLNATGARGVVFLPGVTVGPASLTLSDLSTETETTVDGIQVVDGGITFVDAVLP
jgi:hypothetical protein